MSIVPEEFPDWATDTLNNGSNNTPNKVEPSVPKKANGWNFPEKPPRGEFNWWMNRVGLWVRYFANPTYTLTATATTLTAGDKVIPDNSAATVTLLLPATPSTGDTVYFRQGLGTLYSTFNLIVDRNGSTIQGVSSDLTVTEDDIEFELSFDGTTWVSLVTKTIRIPT